MNVFSVGVLKDILKAKLRSPVDPEIIINIYFCFKFERSPLESSKPGVIFWLPQYPTSPRCSNVNTHPITVCPPPTVFLHLFHLSCTRKTRYLFCTTHFIYWEWLLIRMLHRILRRTVRKWPHQWSGLFVKSLSFVFVLLYFLILINFSEAKIRLGCFFALRVFVWIF